MPKPPKQTQTVFCRYCAYDHKAVGALPETCPGCLRDGSWTTENPIPLKKYELMGSDEMFLKSIGIDSKGKE